MKKRDKKTGLFLRVNYNNKQIYDLYVNHKKPIREIAKIMGISTRPIQTRLREMKTKMRPSVAGLWGEKSYRWKGGKYTDRKGYVYVLDYNSPRGYKGEHRIVMEKHLGRKLKNGECIHHINQKKGDNKLSNLKLMSLEEHISEHLQKKFIINKMKLKINKLTKRIKELEGKTDES